MANEKRLDLIDRSSLGIGKAKREVFDNPAYADGWNSAIAIIENATTVDAVEVVHGRLGVSYMDEYFGAFANCMECGTDNVLPCNFCRNCGAKMDLE